MFRYQRMSLALAMAISTGVSQRVAVCQEPQSRSGHYSTVSPCWVGSFFGLVFLQLHWWFWCTPRLRTRDVDMSPFMKRKKEYLDVFLLCQLYSYLSEKSHSSRRTKTKSHQSSGDLFGPFGQSWLLCSWSSQLSYITFHYMSFLPTSLCILLGTMLFISISQQLTGSTHNGCCMNEWMNGLSVPEGWEKAKRTECS